MNDIALPLPPMPTREQIERLEAAMLQAEASGAAPHLDLSLQHAHGGALYARQITIPAGTVLTGLEHKEAHLNVSAGDITVWTEQGMRRLTGVHVVPSDVGAKRVGYAHAETTWISFHRNPTGETDPAKLAALLVERPELLLEHRRQLIAEA